MKRALLTLLPAGLAGLLVLALRATSPETVERIYSRGAYPVIARAVGSVSDLAPFSLAEALLVLLVVSTLFLAVRGIVRIRRGRSSILRAAWFAARLLLVAVPILFLLFEVLWGINYGRQPVEGKIGYSDERVTPKRFRSMLIALAKSASSDRPPGLVAHDRSVVDRALGGVPGDVDRVVRQLEGRAVPCARRPKTLLLNAFFRWNGIHGITSPFTHEAHHRRDLLDCERPFVAAHEQAHLAGYGSEATANLIGYLASAGSENRLARYSGRLAMLRLFLGAASKEDRAAARPHLTEGVIADINRIRERYRTESAPLREVSRWANDTYLKANRVHRGVGDYGRAVRLVVGADPAVLPVR